MVSKLDLKCENMNSNVLCNKGLSFNSHNSIFGLSFSNGLINYNKGVLGGLLLGCGVLNKFNSNTNKFGCRFYSTTSGEISHNADDFVNDLKSSIGKSNSNKKNRKASNKLEKSILKNLIGGVGFKSYQNLFALGNLLELLNDRDLLVEMLGRFLSSLSNDCAHTGLFVLRWNDDESGFGKGVTIGQSLEVTTKNSPNILASKVQILLEEVFKKYNIESGDCELIVMHRWWLDLSEFTTDLGTIGKTIDEYTVKELYKKESQDLALQQRLDNEEIGRYNGILMDNYGEPIVENGHVVGYKIFKDEGVVVKDVINKNGEKSKLVSVKEIIDGKLVVDERNDIIKWRDTKTPTGFKREMDNVTKYFNQDGRIEYTDGEYNFPDYPVTDIDFEVALLSTCLPAPP